MNIDTTIVNDYLSGGCQYKSHWIFKSIDEDKGFLFESPLVTKMQVVQNGMNDVLSSLKEFCPYNLGLFKRLFPKWKELCDTVNIILTVGCPAPYDAMVREHDGEEFIILDLIRLLEYKADIGMLMTPFLTHELTHICIHADYPDVPAGADYCNRLKYITFDEGFAHLLAYRDNIENIDFSSLVKEHYQKAFYKLKEAISERESEKQKAYLEESNAGDYWNKYGAICGKLYLAMTLDNLEMVYKAGPDKLYDSIIRESMGLVEEYNARETKHIVADERVVK